MPRSRQSSVVLACVVLASLYLWVCPASAQPAPRVGVIAGARVPEALTGQLLSALRTRYDATRIGQSASRRPLRALRVQIAAAEVDLLVLISKQGSALKLEYYDPVRGKRLGSGRLALRAGKLSAQVRAKLLKGTQRWLAKLGVAAAQRSSSAAQAGQSQDARPQRRTDARPTPRNERREPPSSEDETLQASDGEPPQAADLEAEAVADEPVAADEPIAAPSAMKVALTASVGSSMRSGEFRSGGVSSRFDAGAAFALGLGLGVDIGPRDGSHFGIEGRYATSIGRQVSELHRAGEALPMGLRTQRLEGGLGPRFVIASPGWMLGPTLGYALRSVAPERHFQLLPFYTLGGPFLRVALTTPQFGPGIGLRVSPELQWLPQASNRAGGSSLGAGRFALGVQLGVFIHASSAFDFELLLHESHAFAPSDSVEVTDMERFILANVTFRP